MTYQPAPSITPCDLAVRVPTDVESEVWIKLEMTRARRETGTQLSLLVQLSKLWKTWPTRLSDSTEGSDRL
jgi:hypothetical protein